MTCKFIVKCLTFKILYKNRETKGVLNISELGVKKNAAFLKAAFNVKH